VKRWGALLALFLLAVIGAVVIAPRFQPNGLDRRHARIRVGMTHEEVRAIMDSSDKQPASGDPRRQTWYWRCPQVRQGAMPTLLRNSKMGE
jgi:hypothetical protein